MSTKVRTSCTSDWLSIETLTQRAYRTLPRLWWWEEHLADDLFVVVEREGVLVGALFAWPDDSPVAWVRLAVLDDELGAGEWLDLTLPSVLDALRRRGAQALAWMEYRDWSGLHLRVRGFQPLTGVITLVKRDRTLLPEAYVPGAHLRLASDADLSAVVAVDRAAFTPHWWHSEATMRRRAGASSHFVVVEVAGEVVGYAEGQIQQKQGRVIAHLNRIAVRPAHQGCGIGALLLCDALRAFWKRGVEQVTLNTQTDNHLSQRLYRHFGFESVGAPATVWELLL